MNDPRVSALICGLVAVWLGYSIFFAAEQASPTMQLVQWPFFMVAVVGLAVAIYRLVLQHRGGPDR